MDQPKDVGRIIETPDCVAEGIAWLISVEPRFAEAYKQTGPLPLRRSDDGFARLLSAIVSQQVSVAAAEAIWTRVEGAGFVDIHAVKTCDEAELQAVGLSRPKVRYAKALANSGIDFNVLREATNENVVDTLTGVTGIGRWTADIYLMFALGRADAFAPGDLALQESARMLFDLEARPSETQLRDMAVAWSPWRSVAARALWAYYAVMKNREGIR